MIWAILLLPKQPYVSSGSYTPFQLSDLVLKFFKISLAWVIGNFGLHIQIQHPNFSLIANFHDLSANHSLLKKSHGLEGRQSSKASSIVSRKN